jgi:hypothetical protein
LYTKPLPTRERLHHLFDYDRNGHLIRRVRATGNTKCGDVLKGTGQYHRVSVDGGNYSLHRLIYQWHHGITPDIVDHEDRNVCNNRIGNLRDGTGGVNARNR